MNRLPTEKRVQVLNMLLEGMSMRATSRVAEVSFNAIARLLVDAGKVCAEFHDNHVLGLTSRYIEADEIWSFVRAKRLTAEERNISEAGDLWTWTAIDPETKLLVTWRVGQRDGTDAYHFLTDLRKRVETNFQLHTDGLDLYREAVRDAFAGRPLNYAQLVKSMKRKKPESERRYSPEPMDYVTKTKVFGEPDMDALSTSINERHNLTMRMHMRRFTRLTNAYSKKPENHAHMVALYGVWYNFCRPHGTLGRTPAQEAGLIPYAKNLRWIIDLMNARAPAPRRGPYRANRNTNISK